MTNLEKINKIRTELKKIDLNYYNNSKISDYDGEQFLIIDFFRFDNSSICGYFDLEDNCFELRPLIGFDENSNKAKQLVLDTMKKMNKEAIIPHTATSLCAFWVGENAIKAIGPTYMNSDGELKYGMEAFDAAFLAQSACSIGYGLEDIINMMLDNN